MTGLSWLLLMLAVSGGSMTLALSKMGRWLWRLPMRKVFGEQGYYLAQCHYCTSHYVAALVVALYRPVVLGQFYPDLFVAWLALVAGGSAITGLIFTYVIHFQGDNP